MKTHKNRNRQWSFLGFTLYQCTVTRKTIPLDFQENSIRSIGSHLIIHHPDIKFFSLATKDYIKWLSLAQQTFFLGIMHILMEQKAKLVVHSRRHIFLCNTFSKISKEYRFVPLNSSSSHDLFSSAILACIHKISKKDSTEGISLSDLSKVITDYYIGSQYLHHTPEKRFLQALLQAYSKEHNWFQLNITEVAGFRKEYSVSLESTLYKEISASHRFFENNVANAVLNTPILYQFKKELFNTIRFEFHRQKSGKETFDPNNTTDDHYDDDFDFDIDFD